MNERQISFFVRLARQSHRDARRWKHGGSYKAWQQGRRDAFMLAARHLSVSSGARTRNILLRKALATAVVL